MTTDLGRIEASAAAVNRTVDALTPEELAAPSLLPRWSRAHVVAHLALNGEALAGVLTALLHDEPVAMYPSSQRRDADIEALAAADPADLRRRLLAATTLFAEAVEAMDDVTWHGTFSRTPGAPQVPATDVPGSRWCELEIHHADLGAAYTHAEWPEDFCVELLEQESADRTGPFVVRATDLGREWVVGDTEGPVVSGPASALGWWLTGRGAGEGLTCDAGPLPTLDPWRTASATAVPTPGT